MRVQVMSFVDRSRVSVIEFGSDGRTNMSVHLYAEPIS